MKRLAGPFLAAACTLAAALPAAAETRLIHAEPGPNRGVRAEATEWWIGEAARRSGGELAFDIHWGGALFGANAALTSISNGVADSGLIVGSYLESEFPELYMGDLPLSERDPWVTMHAMNEILSSHPAVQTALADKNLAYLGIYATSPLQIGCRNDALTTVDDVKGMKMRYGGVYGPVFSALGGNMVEMSIYDTFQGMETGLIDCTPTYAYFAVATKLDEMLDSLTPIKLSPASSVATFMNRDVFEDLSPEHRKVLEGLRAEVIDHFAERLSKADADAIKKMTTREKPVVIYDLSAEDDARILEAAQPVITQWKASATAKGFDAEALLAEYKRLLDKWAKIRDTQGYPWERG
ncbi:C4-dicarboxylate TRAP transporter substrate-binding protein [Tistrella mobilis]|uniref:C4-dicarboxylate TRAP transporter substrate-binding protein n=1 Tax=Tistrella mobilis TaxID=171437 RepID=UPI003556F6D0